MITCAGLQSDRVAGLAGGSATPRIVPFRGTYYQMKAEYRGVVTRNIYPVPSGGGIPVGVHFTPTVNERRGEQMIVGPGACIAFSREVSLNKEGFFNSTKQKYNHKYVTYVSLPLYPLLCAQN